MALDGPTLTLGLMNFSTAAPADAWGSLLERARLADAAGVDRLFVVDHVVMGSDLDAYDGGRFPTGPDGHWLEPLTTLAVIAGQTTRIRLSTAIIVAALRPAALLAKTLATLDVLSGGRMDLGVGVGWQAREYEAVGVDFATRGRILDDTLGAVRALWGSDPVSYTSDHISFSDVWCAPKPVQPGGVPIWVSGRINARTLHRMVTYGDGWIPWGSHIRDVAPGIATVREALEAAGRDPRAFEVRGSLRVDTDADGRLDLDGAMASVPALVEAGVTDFAAGVQLLDDPAASAGQLHELVHAFRTTVGRPLP